MKIAYILMLALVVTKHNGQHRTRTLRTDGQLIAKMLAVTLPVLILILLQKDFGTMLVFLAIFSGVFLMSGISWKIIVPVFVFMFILGSILIFLVLSETGQIDLNPLLFCMLKDFFCFLDEIFLYKRVLHIVSECLKKSITHSSTNNNFINQAQDIVK